jgi:hypothetical protein
MKDIWIIWSLYKDENWEIELKTPRASSLCEKWLHTIKSYTEMFENIKLIEQYCVI